MPHKTDLIRAEMALPGRSEAMAINPLHAVSGHSMLAPYPAHYEMAYFAMGCSGNKRGSMSPRSVIKAVSLPIQPMRKCVAA